MFICSSGSRIIIWSYYFQPQDWVVWCPGGYTSCKECFHLSWFWWANWSWRCHAFAFLSCSSKLMLIHNSTTVYVIISFIIIIHLLWFHNITYYQSRVFSIIQVEIYKDRIAAALETLKSRTYGGHIVDNVLHGGRGFGSAMESLINYLGSEYGNTFALGMNVYSEAWYLFLNFFANHGFLSCELFCMYKFTFLDVF